MVQWLGRVDNAAREIFGESTKGFGSWEVLARRFTSSESFNGGHFSLGSLQ